MKIVVLGNTGMLGRYMSKFFKQNYDVLDVNRSTGLDALHFEKQTKEEFLKLIKNFRIHEDESIFLINCIGAIKQKYENPEDLFKLNSLFPLALGSMVSKETNIFLIHISSDCVFSGEKELGQVHLEYSVRDAKDYYGMSKVLGEEACAYRNSFVIRTSIIGEELTGKKSLLEWCISNKGKKVNGYTNHLWNGVTCLQLAHAVEHCLHNTLLMPKIVNYNSPAHYTKYFLLQRISEVYELDLDIVPVEDTKQVNRLLGSQYTILKNNVKTDDIKVQLYKQKRFLEI